MKLHCSRLQLIWIGLPLFALAAIESETRTGDQRHYEMVQARRLGDCKSAANSPAAMSDSLL
jgi:hypothetical protein